MKLKRMALLFMNVNCWQNGLPNIWRRGKVPLRCFRDADWLRYVTTWVVGSTWV